MTALRPLVQNNRRRLALHKYMYATIVTLNVAIPRKSSLRLVMWFGESDGTPSHHKFSGLTPTPAQSEKIEGML